MPHYEVIAIIHPDQHARAGEMAERYKKIVSDGGGIVHRFEDWGLRTLAYPMKKQRRAQYILLNIECEAKTLGELQENFRFSDAVMRSMVVRCDAAISEDSPMMKKIQEERIAAKAEAENKAKAESEAKIKAEAESKAEAKTAKTAQTADSAAKAESKSESAEGDVKAKKPARKEKAEAAADNDEEEGDKSIKAPRKSAAKSRRAVAEDENDEDEE
ncbi:MAG: 30S ribosomal protein S6 [Gammaproteobacteria bacterium]